MSFGARVLLLLVPLVSALDPVAAHTAENGDFAGLVDIGGGRRMYLECRGAGSPTVVLISGKGNGAADWSKVLDPSDPVRNAPLDAVGAGEGHLLESEAAVVPAVSRFTRVCAYDRPETRIDGTDISTQIVQPHRVDQAVNDLRTLLAVAGEPGPYVLVAHSYGGLVALLYARLHPEEVAGLVMVDAATDLIKQAAGAEELAGWDASNRVSHPAAPEAVELLDAIGRIEAAPPLPERPAVVVSADNPWQSPAPDAHREPNGRMITFAEWRAAQDLLAASLRATHVAETRSGHNIYLYQPGLVVDAIRKVVDEVRRSGAPIGSIRGAAAVGGRVATEPADPGVLVALDLSSRIALERALDEGFAESGMPGAAIGLWIPGKESSVATRGLADRKSPMTADLQAPIGSITKTFTVTIALQLVGEGRLSLVSRSGRSRQ
jgi:pimeloyl-ACP methyl ester carboxylesterase